MQLMLSLFFRFSLDDYMHEFIVTDRDVYAMAEDNFKSGNILFSDRHSLKSTDGSTTSLIVGSASFSGYAGGVGIQARFDFISSFVQLTPTDVLVVDFGNHCFRTVDRLTNATANFTGTCQVSGDRDGSDHLFSEPRTIIEDLKNPGHFFITEKSGAALRYMSVNAGHINVTTLYRGVFSYRDMVQKTSTGNVYITHDGGVNVYDYIHETMSALVGSTAQGFVDGVFSLTRFRGLSGITLISDSVILVADENNNRLRLLDLSTNTSSSICSGIRGNQDGNLTSCQLYCPLALLMKNDTLYVGGFRRIRKIQGKQSNDYEVA